MAAVQELDPGEGSSPLGVGAGTAAGAGFPLPASGTRLPSRVPAGRGWTPEALKQPCAPDLVAHTSAGGRRPPHPQGLGGELCTSAQTGWGGPPASASSCPSVAQGSLLACGRLTHVGRPGACTFLEKGSTRASSASVRGLLCAPTVKGRCRVPRARAGRPGGCRHPKLFGPSPRGGRLRQPRLLRRRPRLIAGAVRRTPRGPRRLPTPGTPGVGGCGCARGCAR